MKYDVFDDTKMCECLQTLKRCVYDLSRGTYVYKILVKVYKDRMCKGLTLSSSIDYCLNTTHSAGERNMKFNHIYFEIDSLLDNMKNRVNLILFKKDNEDEEAKKASGLITHADDLLNAVVADQQSREKTEREQTEQIIFGNIKQCMREMNNLVDHKRPKYILNSEPQWEVFKTEMQHTVNFFVNLPKIYIRERKNLESTQSSLKRAQDELRTWANGSTVLYNPTRGDLLPVLLHEERSKGGGHRTKPLEVAESPYLKRVSFLSQIYPQLNSNS